MQITESIFDSIIQNQKNFIMDMNEGLFRNRWYTPCGSIWIGPVDKSFANIIGPYYDRYDKT